MQKKENKENEILEAAEKLFAEKGFKGATTTLIAAEAGVTHAMLHYYFRTKDQIFLKVLDTYTEEIRQNLKSIMVSEINDTDFMRKVIEISFDFFNVHSGQMSLFFEVCKERPELIKDYVDKLGKHIDPIIRSHQEKVSKAVAGGQIKKITFIDLIIDIISVCAITPFLSPLLNNVLDLSEEQKKVFMEARKHEAVELIANRLTGKQQ